MVFEKELQNVLGMNTYLLTKRQDLYLRSANFLVYGYDRMGASDTNGANMLCMNTTGETSTLAY